MDKCIKCKNNDGSVEIRAVEIHTIRLKNADKTYTNMQEIYGQKKFSVCDSCIDNYLDFVMKPYKNFFKGMGASWIVLVLGLCLIVRFCTTEKTYTALGVCFVIAFFYRAYKYVKDAKKRKENFLKYPKEDLRIVAAWECACASAPKLSGDARVNYLPIVSGTEKMKREHFVKYYGLTKENADKFYKIVHSSD